MGATLGGMGHSCFWMAGLLDAPAGGQPPGALGVLRPPRGRRIAKQALWRGLPNARRQRPDSVHQRTAQGRDLRFIEKFRIEVLVPENILAIPMHVPLGLAMTEVIAETGLPVIAHHHDFAWERERFTLNGVNDYLQAAFPPACTAWSTWSSTRWPRRNWPAGWASLRRSSPT